MLKSKKSLISLFTKWNLPEHHVMNTINPLNGTNYTQNIANVFIQKESTAAKQVHNMEH